MMKSKFDGTNMTGYFLGKENKEQVNKKQIKLNIIYPSYSWLAKEENNIYFGIIHNE